MAEIRSSRLLGAYALATLALSGVACSPNTANDGNGGSDLGLGGSGTGGAARGGTVSSDRATRPDAETASGGVLATSDGTDSSSQVTAGGTRATGGRTASSSQTTKGGTGSIGGTPEAGGVSSVSVRPGSSGTRATGGAAGRDAGSGGAGAGGRSVSESGGGKATGNSTNATVQSSGCGKTATLTSGTRTIQSGGQSRSFMLRIPADYDNSHPYPLVFAFHWNGGTMGDVDGGGTSGYTWSYYGLREQADDSADSKMIFVAPQGNGNGWANPNGQDLTFVDDMLKQLEGDLCVDTTRLFAMGFSYGGGMSNAIACARATVFRAVAVYAGALLSGCNDGTKPIAYIGVHGITDPTCGIAGGRSLRDRFVKNNGCTAEDPPEPSQGSRTHVCTSYSGCASGYPVRWCAFDGGGHTPAPVDGQAVDSGGGNSTWTKGEVWKFFSQF